MLGNSNTLKIVAFKIFVNLILLRGLSKISKGLYYIAVIVILILVMNSKRLNKLYPLLFCDNISDVSLYEDSSNSSFCNLFSSLSILGSVHLVVCIAYLLEGFPPCTCSRVGRRVLSARCILLSCSASQLVYLCIHIQ
jgi:hypothetical protein